MLNTIYSVLAACFRSAVSLRYGLTTFAVLSVAGANAGPLDPPWLTNEPIVSVERTLYLQQQFPNPSIWAKQFVTGPDLQRIEVVSEENSSDVWVNLRSRFSADNGHTWSDWQPLPDNIVQYNGVDVWEGDDMTMPVYDPQAGVLIQPFHRLIYQNGLSYFLVPQQNLWVKTGLA